jgi:hypothetical protein
MKKMIPLITLILAISILPFSTLQAQQATTGEKEKQKEAEMQLKKAEEMQKKTEMLKQAQQEAEMKNAMIEMQKKENALKEYEIIRKKAEGMAEKKIMIMPDERTWSVSVPDIGNYYYFGNYGIGDKPGSSWNYSRQVLESTFSNEFTMDASGDHGNATLSVSGNCAEGSIAVAIIMPDGKQLSEVLIDANGSLNWRKSFDEGEGNKWKSGKWIFKINAKNATGNVRIGMTSN